MITIEVNKDQLRRVFPSNIVSRIDENELTLSTSSISFMKDPSILTYGLILLTITTNNHNFIKPIHDEEDVDISSLASSIFKYVPLYGYNQFGDLLQLYYKLKKLPSKMTLKEAISNKYIDGKVSFKDILLKQNEEIQNILLYLDTVFDTKYSQENMTNTKTITIAVKTYLQLRGLQLLYNPTNMNNIFKLHHNCKYGDIFSYEDPYHQLFLLALDSETNKDKLTKMPNTCGVLTTLYRSL